MSAKWIPCKWSVAGTEDRLREVYIELIANSRGTDRYAIRRCGSVLARDGEWEIEPIPSERDEDFFKRCRYDTFEEAVQIHAQFCK